MAVLLIVTAHHNKCSKQEESGDASPKGDEIWLSDTVNTKSVDKALSAVAGQTVV